MKYVFLFCGTAESQAEWDNMPEETKKQSYGQVMEWFEKHNSKVTGGQELQGPQAATTVKRGPSGEAVVTDGPFMEGNEVIGGFVEVEVADLDEALQLAKEWPGDAVEIRPIVPH
jgi:hypothetical protein